MLAINGEMMKGRTLTEATEMLQNAEDLITLKIARPIEANSKEWGLTRSSNDQLLGLFELLSKRVSNKCFYIICIVSLPAKF